MYEFKAGTARIIGALESAAADPERREALADLLYYYSDQMTQDIQAVSDFYEKYKERK